MGKTKHQGRIVERSDLDTIKKMKETIKAQQKKIAQLEKELDRREDVSDRYRELLNEDFGPLAPTTTPVTTYKEKCPSCQSETETTPIGKFNLTRCTQCSWRIRR